MQRTGKQSDFPPFGYAEPSNPGSCGSLHYPSAREWASSLNTTCPPSPEGRWAGKASHRHLPTASMPCSRSPDISRQMLFSMSRPVIR